MTTVNRQELVAALRAVRTAAGGTKSLPVLNNVAIEVVEDQLQLTATNLDVYVRRHIPFAGSAIGATTVDAKSFADFATGFSGKDVSLKLDGNKLRLTSGKNRASLAVISADEFPAWPSLADNAVSFTLTREQFEAVVKRVASFASPDFNARPILTGVHIRGNGETVRFAAADNYRVGVLTIDHAATIEAVLPAVTLAAVVKSLEGDEISVTIASNGAMFHSKVGLVMTRLIEGNFPNIEPVIPTAFKSTLLVDPEDLHEAAKLASLASVTSIVKFNLTDAGLHVHSEEMDRDFDTTLDATLNAEGEKDVHFALNTKYVAATAAVFPDSPTVEIGYGGPLAPVTFRDPADSSFLAVVMPVRTND